MFVLKRRSKYADKIDALSILMADAIIVPSFTDVPMGNQKGFRFVSFSTAITHSMKQQLKRNKRLEEKEVKRSSSAFTKQSPPIPAAS